MPSYETGTVFVYQDGRSEQVIGGKDGKVKWRRGDGTLFNANRNFLLPWTYWETAAKRGRAVLVSPAAPLWPTAIGQKASYEARFTVIGRAGQGEPKVSTEHWTCENRGRQRVKVIAGAFDTVRFVCVQAAEGAKRTIKRTWHYAPRIRHYVRFQERIAGEPVTRRTELVAIRPAGTGWPPVTRVALEKRLISALRDAPDGDKVDWKSSGLPTEVTLEMTSRFVGSNGRRCRTYIQTWRRDNVARDYPGVACLTRSGGWVVPGATRGEAAYIAIAPG